MTMSRIYTLTLYPTADVVRKIVALWYDESLECELTVGKRDGERFVTVSYSNPEALNRILKVAKGGIIKITK